MRRLRPGEPDITDLSAPGYLKEWGFTAVQVLEDDPIWTGLGSSSVFLEVHSYEVKDTPDGFQALASTPDCPIQALKRLDRLVYGTQFHPEAFTESAFDRRNPLVNLVYPEGYPEAFPQGRELIATFFRLAGILN
jgi:GMP synthase-like glutamine amidotransferase